MPSSQEVIGVPEPLRLSLKSRKFSAYVSQCYCGFPSPAPVQRLPLPAETRRAPRALLRPAAWLSAAVWVGHAPATPPTRGAGRPCSSPGPGVRHCPRLPQSAVTSPSQGHRPGASAGLERNGQLPAPQDVQGGAEWVCVRADAARLR